MTEKDMSVTARWVAMMRGMHLVIDDAPFIFEDNLARALADIPDDDWGRINEKAGNRSHMIWRSRVTEDQLQASARAGVEQYVILGAGLDSFAYRRPRSMEHIAVFEIDHPATQSWKQRKLRELGINVSDNTHFVPVDFASESLTEKLNQSAFEPQRPTFFSWLGVIYYLNKSATRQTLQAILEMTKGYCEIALDFVVPLEMLSGKLKERMEDVMQNVAEAGEPWLGLYLPDELADTLKQAGFDRVTYMDSADGQKQFFDGRTDNLGLSTALHMMIASRGNLR